MALRGFSEFYPFHLTEHSNRVSRRLHFIGTSISLALVQGYALAWIGHFFFEHNRPATFRHPLWSFMGDWRMWWDILQRPITLQGLSTSEIACD
jgi:hypothetical protein